MNRTIDREQYADEMRDAAADATWAVVERIGREPFSYHDVSSEVAWDLRALGYEDTHGFYGIRVREVATNVSRPLVREMVKAGIVRPVRAYSPPSKPHLFILDGTDD